MTLAVPHRRQRTVYTCGPASLRMVLAYYGKADTEADISEAVSCTADAGTSPGNMARYLRKRGFVARSRSRRNLADIRADLRRGHPVIVAYQAWGGPGVDLSKTLSHGHYAVVVGATLERITLADPSAKKPRIHLDPSDFVNRWCDVDSKQRHYPRWGLTVRPGNKTVGV